MTLFQLNKDMASLIGIRPSGYSVIRNGKYLTYTQRYKSHDLGGLLGLYFCCCDYGGDELPVFSVGKLVESSMEKTINVMSDRYQMDIHERMHLLDPIYALMEMNDYTCLDFWISGFDYPSLFFKGCFADHFDV